MRTSIAHGWGQAALEKIFSSLSLLTSKANVLLQSEIITIDPRQLTENNISWFLKSLSALTSNFRIVPLSELGDESIGHSLSLLFTSPDKVLFSNLAAMLKERKIPFTVALPTSFVGTNNIFWDDKVRSILTRVQNRVELPEGIIKVLEEIQEDFSLETKESKTISDIEIDGMVQLLRKAHPSLRQAVLGDLVAFGESKGLLSAERRFLNWQEVIKLYEEGVTFISANHGYLNLSELTLEEALNSIKKSALSFNEHKIIPVNALYFPLNELPYFWEELLRVLGINLGIGGTETLVTNICRVVSPIEISPQNSQMKSVLLCRVMRRTFIGYKF